MNIEDKIKEAVEFAKRTKTTCTLCPKRNLCDETKDYTGMTFCKNTFDEIMKKLNKVD